MTQADIIGQMARAGSITHKDAEKALAAYYATVAGELAAGERVRMPGIGSLVAVAQAATQGRNPRTGAPIEIAAHRRIKFKTSEALKEVLAAAQ